MIRKSIVLLLLTCLWASGFSQAQNLPRQTVTNYQWIKDWLLCGPFPLEKTTDPAKLWDHFKGYETDYLKKYGGESNLSVKAGNPVAVGKKSVKWIAYSTTDSVVNLRSAISKDAPVMAYAYTEVNSDQDQMYFLAFGSNDGGSVWLNGSKVWDFSFERGLKVDSDLVPVILKKGTNKILCKIEQRGNLWEFCLRFLPFSNQQLAKNDFLKIEARENSQVEITSQYSAQVLNALASKADLTIWNSLGQTVLKEALPSGYKGKINLNPNHYQLYKAQIDVQLKNGGTLHLQQKFYAGKREEYVLFQDRKTAYRIALDASASESEKWAAEELQKWLKEISGADFPIQNLDQPHNGPQIVLGYTPLIKERLNVEAPAKSFEGYQYINSGRDILIFGGSQRGTMYGVLAFLENELGCRWYTPTVNNIPKRNELRFARFEHSEQPGVRVRNDFYFEAFDPIWATRNKMNGSMSAPKQPGGIESYWAVHTFYPLMPPEEFFGKHPEYYSLINGKREHVRAQLCLTNPDVLSIITERIKKRMRESPEYLIYDVSQNDWRNPCECDHCQEIVKREGSESGVIVWFVNQVADAVAKEFPDKFIGTLAYQYTRKPPLHIRPKDNVVVRFCSIECCFSHDFNSCPENQAFLKELNDWAFRAPHLYIWDYVVNFGHYLMPFPNFGVLQSNIKTFQKNNAIGIMEQAAYQSRGGEFAELRAYLIAKLLWNPDCNVENTINDFMYGYYGRSGKFVRQYFDFLHSQITPQTHMYLNLNPSDEIFSEQLISQSYDIFEEAKKVADNEEILRRVEMASLPILYLKCRRMPVLAKYDGTYALFCKITERENVTYFAESGGREAFHDLVKNAR
ncbi:hypothetical protein DYBT9275_02186 [Dyadobacter sp. CECT 9275]|uniref:DUF4838 domain-containing protein n=1 Tax=Dyadobacter helix TaxID=2822344 RepID=A0A916JBR1_9BACT|nr:DUF4838 domain-containing protein [Dyadobacter sp. CECT 9275]CAG4999246.1 hypothetical protein DYBT9275_02186 [Dyadobacter sp. CECT 9275]